MEQDLLKLIAELDERIAGLEEERDSLSWMPGETSLVVQEQKTLVKFRDRLVQIMEANSDWRYSETVMLTGDELKL